MVPNHFWDPYQTETEDMLILFSTWTEKRKEPDLFCVSEYLRTISIASKRTLGLALNETSKRQLARCIWVRFHLKSARLYLGARKDFFLEMF